MKHEIINGIYYRDGKPTLALGVSYYPSFHYAKYQVPPSGDRIGNMRLDLADIQKCGFHFIRAAALCTPYTENDKVRFESDFIDELARHCDTYDLACSLRLQGYVTNFRGNTDYIMKNERDEEMKQSWSAFMLASFFHEGINRDTMDLTQALAAHFRKFNAVFSFQIFNEPHYAANGVFDYNPHTLAAYRKTLFERGLMSEEQAQQYKVPRSRPTTKDEIAAWVDWRLFATEAMGRYLDRFASAVKEVAPEMDTYTCYTTNHTQSKIANSGTTPFDDTVGLSTVGITEYTPFEGSNFFHATEVLATAESAAACAGKRAWHVEVDTRMNIPIKNFLVQTFAIVGAGFKGLNFYEWRGDYAAEGTPLPDNCGFIHNDRTPSDHFDQKIEMIRLIGKLNDALVLSERKRGGIAILYSNHSAMTADAASNPILDGINRYTQSSYFIYKDLKSHGFSPDFVRAVDLERNPLDVHFLFVPYRGGLSNEEVEQIESFIHSGGTVFYYGIAEAMNTNGYDGYRDWTKKEKNVSTKAFEGALDIEDLIEEYHLTPLACTNHRHVFCEVLENESQYIITLLNNASYDRSAQNIEVNLKALKHIVSAKLYTVGTEHPIKVCDNTLHIPELYAGAFIVCEKE